MHIGCKGKLIWIQDRKRFLYQKRKPTRTKRDENIEITKKYRKRISIINGEKKALQTGKGIYTPNREMHSKLTQKVVHIRKFSH